MMKRRFWLACLPLFSLVVLVGDPATAVRDRGVNLRGESSGGLARVSVRQASETGPSQDEDEREFPQAVSLQMESFRFVGESSETSATHLLDPGDAALLMATRNAATLDEVLDAGVPFQTTQIERLEQWGLLRQEGMEFRSLVPILLQEEAAELRAWLADVVPDIEESVHSDFEGLRGVLSAAGGGRAFPAVASWVVQELSWRYLVAGSMDPRSRIREQRQRHPDRGWWGFLWYVDAPASPVNDIVSYRYERHTLQLCWPSGHEPFVDTEEALRAPIVAFLDELPLDEGTVEDVDRLRALRSLRLVDPQGRLLVPVLRWDEGRAGPGAAAAGAARALAAAIRNRLRQTRLRQLLGTDDDALVAAVAYYELAPRLMTVMADRGLPVMVDQVASQVLGDGEDQATEPSGATDRPIVVALWQGLPEGDPSISLPW